MSRTELLQEVRKMRFEEARGGWQERRLTQASASTGRTISPARRNRHAARVSRMPEGISATRTARLPAREQRVHRRCEVVMDFDSVRARSAAQGRLTQTGAD